MPLYGNFDASGVAAVITSLGVLTAAMTGLVVAITKLWQRDEITDKRVDQLWKAHMRMGKREAEHRTLIQPVEQRGPDDMDFALRPDVRAAYQPISLGLKQIYHDLRKATANQFSEVMLTEKLEERFGMWLSKHICGPLNLKEYACLEMAKIVAMEDDEKPPSWTKENTTQAGN